jgi:NADH-quinone oxidoreductase subunit E
MDTQVIDQILEKYEYQHSDIIEIMQDVQRIENYLPMASLLYVSEKLELSLTRIFDIATFYKAFSLKPRGRHIIKVCCGTACHLNGASQSLDQITRKLDIEEGEMTEDRLFSLETVNCLGTCALAPVIVIGENYHESADTNKIDKILSTYQSEEVI